MLLKSVLLRKTYILWGLCFFAVGLNAQIDSLPNQKNGIFINPNIIYHANCARENGRVAFTIGGGNGSYIFLCESNDTTIIDTISSSTLRDLPPGNYQVFIQDIADFRLQQNTFFTIEKFGGVVADFDFSPHEIEIIQSATFFMDKSEVAPNDEIESWRWSFGDEHFSLDKNPFHKYEGVGMYRVNFEVQTRQGCVDTISKLLFVKDIMALYMPTAFSPNSDGVNDEYFGLAVTTNIQEFDFYIYDRRGVIMYHTNDYNEKWNGTYMNKADELMKEDVYVYHVIIRDISGSVYSYRGKTLLIR